MFEYADLSQLIGYLAPVLELCRALDAIWCTGKPAFAVNSETGVPAFGWLYLEGSLVARATGAAREKLVLSNSAMARKERRGESMTVRGAKTKAKERAR